MSIIFKSMNHFFQADLENTVLTLRSQIRTKAASVNELRVLNTRMNSMFSRCSLYSLEGVLSAREVLAVTTATSGSAISQSILQSILLRLKQDKIHPSQHRIRLSTVSEDSDGDGEATRESTLSTLKISSSRKLKTAVDSKVLRKTLLLLRATCLSWQLASTILSTDWQVSGEGDLFSSATTSLHNVFQRVQESQVANQEGFTGEGEPNSTVEHDDALFAEVEHLTLHAEDLIQPLLNSLALTPLPPLENLQPSRKGSISASKGEDIEITSTKKLTSQPQSNPSLRHFYLACHSSYLALSSDLLAAFISARIIPGRSFSPSPSPLTVSPGAFSEEECSLTLNSDLPSPKENAPAPSPHSAAVSDLCKTLRIEIESIGLLQPGGILKIARIRDRDPRSDQHQTQLG
jgi:hypothetical protein